MFGRKKKIDEDKGIKFPNFPEEKPESDLKVEGFSTIPEEITTEPKDIQLSREDQQETGFEAYIRTVVPEGSSESSINNLEESTESPEIDLTTEELIFNVVKYIKDSNELLGVLAKKAAAELYNSLTESQRLNYLKMNQQLNHNVKGVIENENMKVFVDSLANAFHKTIKQIFVQLN